VNDAARLWQLTRTVAREARTADIWPQFHAQALDLTGASSSVLLRLNSQSGDLVPMSAAGLDDLPARSWLTSDAGRAAAERTWSEGVPLVFTDVAELNQSLGASAAMLVPISSREDRLGLLALGIDETDRAGAAQAHAGVVGELIAVTFERARLEREADVQQEVRELVSDVSRTASSPRHLSTSLELFCDRTRRVFGADRVGVWLHDRRARTVALVASSDAGELLLQRAVPADDETHPIAHAMRATRSSLTPENGANRPRTVLVPLRGRRRALGTLILEGIRLETGEEVDTLHRLDEVGRQLSAAVENLWLLEDVLRSRRQLEHTVNALADLVVVVDRSLHVTHSNQAFGRRLGRPSDEILERPLSDFLGPEVVGWLSKLVDGGAPARVQSKELQDSVIGSTFLYTASPLIGRDDDWTGLVIVARDVSEQARYEAERAELRYRLTQSEKLAALGQFVAGIAHELNNPLQGVLGHTELMLHTPNQLSPKTRRELKLVFREADRAAKIVHNLLVFAGSRRITRRRLNLSLVVARALALRASARASASIDVVRRLERKLPRIAGDSLLLQQALLNIVVNAEQALASREGPRLIEVTTRRRGSKVEVRVADNGPGIPPEVLPRLFEPFFTTKEVGKGTGLGLAIAYGIAQEHGGDLHASNRVEGGAVFTLELPLGADAVE
jgi:signal transduction histidine kinase